MNTPQMHKCIQKSPTQICANPRHHWAATRTTNLGLIILNIL